MAKIIFIILKFILEMIFVAPIVFVLFHINDMQLNSKKAKAFTSMYCGKCSNAYCNVCKHLIVK